MASIASSPNGPASWTPKPAKKVYTTEDITNVFGQPFGEPSVLNASKSEPHKLAYICLWDHPLPSHTKDGKICASRNLPCLEAARREIESRRENQLSSTSSPETGSAKPSVFFDDGFSIRSPEWESKESSPKEAEVPQDLLTGSVSGDDPASDQAFSSPPAADSNFWEGGSITGSDLIALDTTQDILNHRREKDILVPQVPSPEQPHRPLLPWSKKAPEDSDIESECSDGDGAAKDFSREDPAIFFHPSKLIDVDTIEESRAAVSESSSWHNSNSTVRYLTSATSSPTPPSYSGFCVPIFRGFRYQRHDGRHDAWHFLGWFRITEVEILHRRSKPLERMLGAMYGDRPAPVVDWWKSLEKIWAVITVEQVHKEDPMGGIESAEVSTIDEIYLKMLLAPKEGDGGLENPRRHLSQNVAETPACLGQPMAHGPIEEYGTLDQGRNNPHAVYQRSQLRPKSPRRVSTSSSAVAILHSVRLFPQVPEQAHGTAAQHPIHLPPLDTNLRHRTTSTSECPTTRQPRVTDPMYRLGG